MTYNILASEAFDLPNPLPNNLTIDIYDGIWQDKQKLVETAKQYDALIVRNMTKLDATLLASLPSIKVIGRLGAGIENIDVVAAHQQGMSVVYAPVQNTNAVAEFCVGQVFNALRRLPNAMTETKEGQWNRGSYLSSGKELRHTTVGVIGFGHIGKAFAEKMQALGANVLVYNRTKEKVAAPFQYTELASVLANSDIISLHLPGGKATQHFVDEAFLQKIKQGAFLINTSRGDVIDEEALLTALQSKHLAGAMLDVRSVEPAGKDDLSQHPQVFVTPHIAAFSAESQSAIAQSVVSDVYKVLQGESAMHPVVL